MLTLLPCLAVVGSVLVSTGCTSLLPKAPISMARVAQVERVTQRLNFVGMEEDEIVEILMWTMGDSSARDLAYKLLPVPSNTEEEARRNLDKYARTNLETVAQLVLVLYLDPTDTSKCFIDGWGRYIVLCEDRANHQRRISAGADFYFESDKFPILGAHTIPFELTQFVSWAGISPAADEQMRVYYEIEVETLDSGVFRIRDVDHSVKVKRPGQDKVEIGKIRFESRFRAEKLFDARSIQYLHHDYRQMLGPRQRRVGDSGILRVGGE